MEFEEVTTLEAKGKMWQRRNTKFMNCDGKLVIKIQFTIAIEISNFTVIAGPNERSYILATRSKTSDLQGSIPKKSVTPVKK